ncbi:MAG TPA: hypothetical protein VFZ21_16330 [Gemmatimonadaceae bacterium]|nr:hypothetical protein [Gemmatimonadaceae bacterium]
MANEQVTPGDGASAGRVPATDAAGAAENASAERESRPDVPAQLASETVLADVEEAGLTDEEIAMYRRRVAEGFYNSREVAAEVARRMLRSRDI